MAVSNIRTTVSSVNDAEALLTALACALRSPSARQRHRTCQRGQHTGGGGDGDCGDTHAELIGQDGSLGQR